ncbi:MULTISPECIES: 2-oxoacid:acceptor oxidoreductase family protein [Metallosphaera]|uniref:pyruvate synthase n=3 Tax=Metallosphaera TaxID=41980 RepID=A4YDI1_METS5|nr:MULTISPECIES: 2-oxoacid:acceptor oxidoreductase family protein [Metallosphaera]ABP94483.1 pyruvate ferredoxin oxidoreductase, gamma subunit [Metallosphaera sedula DSM 5348]AIM26470.1 pyruvate ferredoxin oxidoreductase, gamma subunit [Metallosphaera sedula]AKV73466.1 pyruvate synthase [Metallosphaera sedula]AKV75708.1 pyruvate synthase [Metallosphaera sedula]AKV77955.1 pyruvate synthase [Metallosphaera sedula]
MESSLEIRFHGRGGQGVVTAANLLAEAAGLDGLFSSAFPIYGAERRGAEIESYCRISDSQIRETSPIEEPDVVVILDPTLLKISNPLKGLKKDGKIVLNWKGNPPVSGRIFLVDATGIAMELKLVKSGWPLVNILMLGALVKAVGVPSLDSVKKAIDSEFSGNVAELNKRAVELAYESTREVKEIVA